MKTKLLKPKTLLASLKAVNHILRMQLDDPAEFCPITLKADFSLTAFDPSIRSALNQEKYIDVLKEIKRLAKKNLELFALFNRRHGRAIPLKPLVIEETGPFEKIRLQAQATKPVYFIIDETGRVTPAANDKDITKIRKDGQIYFLLGELVITSQELNGWTNTEEPEKPTGIPEIRPVFRAEYIDDIYNCIKGYFSTENQQKLYDILTASDNANEFLVFKGSGIGLADAFRLLFQEKIITGCPKSCLEQWIRKNFKYLHRGQVTEYGEKYLNNIVSTGKELCKNPIINIKKDTATGRLLIYFE